MKREYYFLEEAASEAGYAVADLIHFGATGQIQVCALMSGSKAIKQIWDDDPEANEFAAEQTALDAPTEQYLWGPYELPRYILRMVEAGKEGLLNRVYPSKPGKSTFLPTVLNLDPPISLSELCLIVLSSELSRMTDAAAMTESEQAIEVAPTDRAHVSDKLALLNQAAARFWAKADRNDRSTHTENATIVKWLIERGYSPTLAEKAATIIRPEWVPTGRKPEE